MNNLLIKQFNEHNITIYGTTEKPLFKAKDIGDLLGIKNIREVIKDYSEKQKDAVSLTDTIGRNQCSVIFKLILPPVVPALDIEVVTFCNNFGLRVG